MGYTDLSPVSVPRLSALALSRAPSLAACLAQAQSSNGRLTQGAATRIAQVYSGPAPDGVSGTPDDGTLILDGTSQTLVLTGSVAMVGDLILKGRISGQGCLFAGRNIYLVGDLIYASPPTWPKPDRTPQATAAANRGRDLVVLVARGNIVIGNYTSMEWSNRVWQLMTDAALHKPYAVDPEESALGYDSDNNPANGAFFDGRYAVAEPHGGLRLATGGGTAPLRFYESSLAPSVFAAACDASVSLVDAVLVSNHAIIGNWGAPGGNKTDALLNGALAARDDYTAYYSRLFLNWDIRLGYRSLDHIPLPFAVPLSEGAVIPTTRTWREIQ